MKKQPLLGNALVRMPAGGGEETLVLTGASPTGSGNWVLREDGIYFFNLGAKPLPSIQFLDFATGEVRQVAEISEESFSGEISVAPDGSYLLYTAFGDTEADIMLVENFR